MDPFENLRQRFRARCQVQLAELQALDRQRATTAGESALEAMIGMVHLLAGAGGTFGFDALSEKAAAAEALLRNADNDNPDEIAVAMQRLFDEMSAVANG